MVVYVEYTILVLVVFPQPIEYDKLYTALLQLAPFHRTGTFQSLGEYPHIVQVRAFVVSSHYPVQLRIVLVAPDEEVVLQIALYIMQRQE